jgi:hypothetical protein
MNARVRRFALTLFGVFGVSSVGSQAAAQSDVPPVEVTPAPPPGAEPTPPAPPAPLPPMPMPMPMPGPMMAAPPPPADFAPPPPPPPPAGQTPLKIDAPNGSSIKFGLLAQPQYESVGAFAGSGMSQNLYLRRIRILVGGTIFKDVEYFFDTDFPNMFKAGADGVKTGPGMYIQDAFATYKPVGDLLKIDVGFMLPPMSHNAVQSAASLLSWDYFTYSFQHSNVFGSTVNPIGRDLGAELRGLLMDGHIEYRAGLFQGRRNVQIPPAAAPGAPAVTVDKVASRNSFRMTGRLQLNFLDPETGFFYGGTYLGTKKILSLGGSYDYQHSQQDSYKYWDVDAFLDLPLGPGVLTAQANLVQYKGGTQVAVALPKQTALMGEAGYRINDLKLSPIVRAEHLWGTGALRDESRYSGGLALWCHGHNSNLKAFYTRVHRDGAMHNYNQVNVQWQVFFF